LLTPSKLTAANSVLLYAIHKKPGIQPGFLLPENPRKPIASPATVTPACH
jgi:hypothetical protein